MKLTLKQRKNYEFILWAAILYNCFFIYYSYHELPKPFFYITVIVELILLALMIRNNKAGLKMEKQQKKEQSD